MKYFLRFTNTATEDLERGTSLLDLPSLSETQVLGGLCGYSFCDLEDIDCNIMTEEEVNNRVEMYRQNSWYNGTPVLFKGEYIEQNVNGEGVIFEAIEIYKTY